MEKWGTGNGERGTGEVINNPASRACARAVCKPIGQTQTCINNTGNSPNHGRVRAYARKRFHDEMVKAWLDRVFSESIEDPVKVAVAEAVKAFGQDKDFGIWAWYANRIGVNNFLELYFTQKSVMEECRLRSPARAFHARLKSFYLTMQAMKVRPFWRPHSAKNGGV